MLYEVTFLRTFPLGTEEVSYKIYLNDNEIAIGEDEFDFNAEDLAIEFALDQFFKTYILGNGGKIEVVGVKRLA